MPTEKIIWPSAVCMGKLTASPCWRSWWTALTMSSVLFRELLTANFLNGSDIIAETEEFVQGQERSAHRFCTVSPRGMQAGQGFEDRDRQKKDAPSKNDPEREIWRWEIALSMSGQAEEKNWVK